MTHIAGEVTIGAPVDAVFDTVADERNEPHYNPRIVRAEKVSAGPVGVGARFVAQAKGTGSRGQMTLTIVEYVRPHRLHNQVRSKSMRVDGIVTFEAVAGANDHGSATHLRWDWDMRLIGPMRILYPALTVIGPAWERRNWLALKRYLESGHPHGAGVKSAKDVRPENRPGPCAEGM